jgi:hypothetical protein
MHHNGPFENNRWDQAAAVRNGCMSPMPVGIAFKKL